MPAVSESRRVRAPNARPFRQRAPYTRRCRSPWQQNFDASIQKSFRLGESGKPGLQFRVDLLNAFNHPVFAVYPDNGGGTDFMSDPSTATLTTAAWNTWAIANNQPLYTTTAGVALYNQIVANVNNQKVNGVLPANFGTLYNSNTPRFIQFGVKLYF